ncbi:MAG: tryptophan-rich sensory protein [Bacillota bacterium]|nr:tryptophan-rich sensory protein [Bacillota bacterium]
MSEDNYKLFRFLNILSFITMVYINVLAVIIPINGVTTGQLSNLYSNLFTPAGITFSIWGVIYLLLLIFIIFQAKENGDNLVRNIGPFFIISCLLNGSWIFAWHYKFTFLSVVIMLSLLLSLIFIYTRLGIGKIQVSNKVKYMVHMPFSIYLGWISIAAIANITALLVKVKWRGLGLNPVSWTIFALALGTLITLLLIWNRNDIFFPVSVLWAFLGIIIKRLSSQGDFSAYIVINVIICMTLILLALLEEMKKERAVKIISHN